VSTEGNELYQARLRIAERIGPDEDYLKAHLAYRPALSAADLIEYDGYAWGWFVAAGGMAAVGAIAHGAAEKLGENVSEAAWKRLTKVFNGSPTITKSAMRPASIHWLTRSGETPRRRVNSPLLTTSALSGAALRLTV